MPEEKFPTPEVNLLSEDELSGGNQGKFIQWALTWGRRIVVLTELVVILAFLSRFWLDTTVANLADTIEQKRAVVLSLADFEQKYRAVLNLVGEAQKIENGTPVLAVYDQTTALIPNGVVLEQMNVNGAKVSFNGTCTEPVLFGLVDNFRQSASFSAVTVERIATGEKGPTIDFSFGAEYGHE